MYVYVCMYRHKQHKRLVKMEVTSDDMLNFAHKQGKVRFVLCGHFLAPLQSVFCPVLQCNNVAYFARSFPLPNMVKWHNGG